MATTLGAVLVGWQSATAWITWREDDAEGWSGAGPLDLHGSLAFWGIRQRAIDAIALSVALATKGTVREARGFTSST